MDIQALRTVGKQSSKTKWYKEFCRRYDADWKTVAKWLKTEPAFEVYLKHTGYYPGKSGPGFQSLEIYSLRFPDIVGSCVICGNQTRWAPNENAWRKTCGRSCAAKECMPQKSATNMGRYGVENPSQSKVIQKKRVKAFIKRFGVDNPWKSRKVQSKSRASNLKRFGVENVSQAQVIKDKKQQTSMENFGDTHWTKVYLSGFDTDNPMWNEKSKKKMERTNIKRYGHKRACKNPEIAAKCKESMHKLLDNPDRRRAFVAAIAKTKMDKHGDPHYTGEKYNRYKVKDASGKLHTVQGYERFVIPDLDAKNVAAIKSSKVPRIGYLNRTYIPDLLVTLRSGAKRLIEVKSAYILRDNLRNNYEKFLAAEKACADRKNATFWLALVADNKAHSVKWIKNPSDYVKQLLAQV